jgi:hypothetical protein
MQQQVSLVSSPVLVRRIWSTAEATRRFSRSQAVFVGSLEQLLLLIVRRLHYGRLMIRVVSEL